MLYKEDMELKLLQFKMDQLHTEIIFWKKIGSFTRMLLSGMNWL